MSAVFSTPLIGRDLTSGPNAAPGMQPQKPLQQDTRAQMKSPLRQAINALLVYQRGFCRNLRARSFPGAYRTGDGVCSQARLIVCALAVAGPDLIAGTVSVRYESGHPIDKLKVKTGSPGEFNNGQEAGTGVSFPHG
jgi:hypothetical protein